MNLKHLLILAAVGLGFCWALSKIWSSGPGQAVKQVPVSYTRSLQADERRAEQAQQAANEAIRKTEESVKGAE